MKCEMRVSAAPPQPTWNSLFEAGPQQYKYMFIIPVDTGLICETILTEHFLSQWHWLWMGAPSAKVSIPHWSWFIQLLPQVVFICPNVFLQAWMCLRAKRAQHGCVAVFFAKLSPPSPAPHAWWPSALQQKETAMEPGISRSIILCVEDWGSSKYWKCYFVNVYLKKYIYCVRIQFWYFVYSYSIQNV